jgi:Mor family transcriptional regulator
MQESLDMRYISSKSYSMQQPESSDSLVPDAALAVLEVRKKLHARQKSRQPQRSNTTIAHAEAKASANAGVTTLLLVELLGVEDFTTLTRVLGGTSFKVPMRITPNMLELLSYSLAAKLVAHFGGLRFDVPKGRLLRGVQTHLAVLKLTQQGLGTAEIARSLNLTRRYINMVLRAQRMQANPPAHFAA